MKISLAHKGNFSRDFDIKYDYLDHTRSNMSYLPGIKKNKFDLVNMHVTQAVLY